MLWKIRRAQLKLSTRGSGECGKGEEKCGRREEKGRVNAVEESRGRNGSNVGNPGAKALRNLRAEEKAEF